MSRTASREPDRRPAPHRRLSWPCDSRHIHRRRKRTCPVPQPPDRLRAPPQGMPVKTATAARMRAPAPIDIAADPAHAPGHTSINNRKSLLFWESEFPAFFSWPFMAPATSLTEFFKFCAKNIDIVDFYRRNQFFSRGRQLRRCSLEFRAFRPDLRLRATPLYVAAAGAGRDIREDLLGVPMPCHRVRHRVHDVRILAFKDRLYRTECFTPSGPFRFGVA